MHRRYLHKNNGTHSRGFKTKFKFVQIYFISRMNFIIFRYSEIKNGLSRNNRFHSQGNLVEINRIRKISFQCSCTEFKFIRPNSNKRIGKIMTLEITQAKFSSFSCDFISSRPRYAKRLLPTLWFSVIPSEVTATF